MPHSESQVRQTDFALTINIKQPQCTTSKTQRTSCGRNMVSPLELHWSVVHLDSPANVSIWTPKSMVLFSDSERLQANSIWVPSSDGRCFWWSLQSGHQWSLIEDHKSEESISTVCWWVNPTACFASVGEEGDIYVFPEIALTNRQTATVSSHSTTEFLTPDLSFVHNNIIIALWQIFLGNKCAISSVLFIYRQ